MAAVNPGNPAMGGMPMMNNMQNGVMPRPGGEQGGINYDARLNAWIYGYLLDKGQWELARSLKNSNLVFEPPLSNGDEDINGASEDTKTGDKKKPDDLPSARHAQDEQGGSMLLSWFSLFWDMYAAQRRRPEASKGANHLMEQNRVRELSAIIIMSASAYLHRCIDKVAKPRCIVP